MRSFLGTITQHCSLSVIFFLSFTLLLFQLCSSSTLDVSSYHITHCLLMVKGKMSCLVIFPSQPQSKKKVKQDLYKTQEKEKCIRKKKLISCISLCHSSHANKQLCEALSYITYLVFPWFWYMVFQNNISLHSILRVNLQYTVVSSCNFRTFLTATEHKQQRVKSFFCIIQIVPVIWNFSNYSLKYPDGMQ